MMQGPWSMKACSLRKPIFSINCSQILLELTLYMKRGKGYTSEGAEGKNNSIATKRRNLLLRMMRATQNPITRRFPMIDSEDNRLRAFHPMKEQIRGSKEHLIVGSDIANEKHHAFFGFPQGRHYGSDWSLETAWKDLKSFTCAWMHWRFSMVSIRWCLVWSLRLPTISP